MRKKVSVGREIGVDPLQEIKIPGSTNLIREVLLPPTRRVEFQVGSLV